MPKPSPIPDARYAIYYRPPEDDPLVRMADRWLGRSPAGAAVSEALIAGLEPDVRRRWIAAPALYGFHGTLKPPFRLAQGRSLPELTFAIDALAAAQHAFVTRPLKILRVGRFLALGFGSDVPPVTALAARCVQDLDDFRAPPTDAELARRRAGGLTARQDALLRNWGYPYVLEEFRFHMTLTGALAEEELGWAGRCLDALFDSVLGKPLPVAEICLFEQPAAGALFHIVSRHAFKGRS